MGIDIPSFSLSAFWPAHETGDCQRRMATILIVDDDPLQAFLRKAILEKRFTDVQRVADPAEALCLVEQPQFARDLGLVITGHHGAAFGGAPFVAEIRARLPGVRVLVIGEGEESSVDYDEEGVFFAPRPVASRDLLALAREMLGGDARNAA
jgi:DNA-binding NtrC family response regulator